MTCVRVMLRMADLCVGVRDSGVSAVLSTKAISRGPPLAPEKIIVFCAKISLMRPSSLQIRF
mgnify:CR=1 FL=1